MPVRVRPRAPIGINVIEIMIRLLFVLFSVIAVTEADEGEIIFLDEYGDDWPYTVESGCLTATSPGAMW